MAWRSLRRVRKKTAAEPTVDKLAFAIQCGLRELHQAEGLSQTGCKITTVAGNGTAGFSDNGTLATSANLSQQAGIFVDGGGSIFLTVGLYDYEGYVIREVSAKTHQISTVAGAFTMQGYQDGTNASSAQFDAPLGLSGDKQGNLCVADQANNVIRKIAAIQGTDVSPLTPTPNFADSERLSHRKDHHIEGRRQQCNHPLHYQRRDHRLDGHRQNARNAISDCGNQQPRRFQGSIFFGFSRRGMNFTLLNLPSGAKAQDFRGFLAARLKPCPFKALTF